MQQILLNGLSLETLLTQIERLIEEKLTKTSPEKAIGPEYITRQELCLRLKVSLVTLHSWTKKGILKSYKIGNRVLYKSSEIHDTISALKRKKIA
ncbi:MAG: helix-turn-helix domain-containing protein [Rufibacter sp.]